MNVGGAELFIIGIVLLLVVVPVAVVLWVVSRATRNPPGPAAVMTVGPAAVPGPGRWYADPTGRFAQRWWDGAPLDRRGHPRQRPAERRPGGRA